MDSAIPEAAPPLEPGAILAIAQTRGLPAALDAINQILATLDDYDQLGRLADELARLSAIVPPSIELALAQSNVHRRRGGLGAASDVLFEATTAFPDNPDILYTGIICAVEAGFHERTVFLLEALASNLTARSDQILRGMWRIASRVGRHDIAAAAFRAALAADSPHARPGIGFRCTVAQAIQAAAWRHGVPTLSIGENCLPWMVMNRWGFYPDPAKAWMDSIFNLSGSSTDACTSILADAGASLMNPEDLGIGYDNSLVPFLRNIRHGISFNHETGPYWVEDSFVKFREFYRIRTENFASGLNGGPRLYVHYTALRGDLARLLATLSSITKNDDYRVLVVDSWEEDRHVAVAGHGKADYLHAPLPRADYIWHHPDTLDSPEGVRFEWRIAQAALRSISTLLGRDILDMEAFGPCPGPTA